MLAILVSIIFAGIGTIFGDIVLSDEFYRTVNTFLNLLSGCLIPLVIFKIGQWNKNTRPQIEETKEQVDKVAERTEHLESWDGETERRH